MAELELVGLHEDGEHLVLAAADGQRYRLHIDEPLRAAVRRDRPQLEQIRAEQSGVPSPREIQARVRAGASAEQIAEESGLGVEHVRRFEGPVLAEREFIAQQAQQTRIGRDVGAPVLGDLVLDRLAARGVDTADLVWDAFREPGAGWTVVARYTVQDEPREARWGYDPSARAVHADEDEARWLSETEIADGPLPRRHLTAVRDVVYDVDAEGSVRPVLAAVDAGAPAPEDPAAGTDDLLDDLRARRGVRQALDLEDDDEGEFPGFGPQHAFDFGLLDAPGAHPVDADPAEQARVYEVPARSAHRPDSEPAASEPAATDGDAPAEPPAQPAAPAEGTTRTEPRPRGRRGRAKVPSWDEIVFGAKPE
ncbi:MAG TPA: septation protein SepH [Cellulomonas sp.]